MPSCSVDASAVIGTYPGERDIPTLSKETLRAVIEAAHSRGKVAVVHVLSLHGAKDAIDAGADGLAHLFTERPADEEFISLAAQHHVFVIPTFSVLATPGGASAGPVLASDPRLEPYLSVEASPIWSRMFPAIAALSAMRK